MNAARPPIGFAEPCNKLAEGNTTRQISVNINYHLNLQTSFNGNFLLMNFDHLHLLHLKYNMRVFINDSSR